MCEISVRIGGSVLKRVDMKKRKLDEPPVKVESKPGATVAKPIATKPIAPPTKALPTFKKEPTAPAKADMSFFGATPNASGPSKPRLKLPDIKKRDSNAAPAPVSTSSLLSATMSMLSKKPTDSPLNALPINTPDMDVKPFVYAKPGKGKRVRFRDLIPDGGALEEIREFRQEPHELEPAPWADTVCLKLGDMRSGAKGKQDVHGQSAHQLDMDEGKAMRIHEKVQEAIEWYEPDGEFPSNNTSPTSDRFDAEYVSADTIPLVHSLEAQEQEARERGILALNYLDQSSEPDETNVRIVERGADTFIMDPPGYQPPSIPGILPAPVSTSTTLNLSELLGKINPIVLAPPPPQPATYDWAQQPQQQIQPQHIAPQDPYAYQNNYPVQPQPQEYTYPTENSGWNQPSHQPLAANPYPGAEGNNRPPWGGGDNYARNYDRDDGSGGRWGNGRSNTNGGGGGGRGRGSKKRVCRYWLKNK